MKEKLFFSLLSTVLLLFNFFYISENRMSLQDFRLQNIALMQANAGEASCDQSDQTSCEIIICVNGGRIVGTSYGKVVGSN